MDRSKHGEGAVLEGVVVKEKKGYQAFIEVEHLDFQPFSDLEKAVKDDVAWLQSKKIEEGINFTGWVYEVETGKVRRVV